MDMDTEGPNSYLCYYCDDKCQEFSVIIDHSIVKHPLNELKYRRKTISDDNKIVLQTKNFHVVPNELKKEGKYILSNTDTGTITINEFSECPVEGFSPLQKKGRWPKKSVVDDVNIIEDDLQADTSNETEDQGLSKLIEILPSVLANLKETGHEDMYIKFSELVASRRFPLGNIAFLLFNDVVQWYSLDNTCKMRYDDVVKRFWRTGHKLFKGKFLRFMSGMKNVGTVNDGSSERGIYEPEKSEINFAVPSRSILDNVGNPICDGKLTPGLIPAMLDTLSASDPEQINTYKMCVDGKKINASVQGELGDVDLWNHEDKPTLHERRHRVEEELKTLEEFSELLSSLEVKAKEDIEECTSAQKTDVQSFCTRSMHIISNRIRDLRQLKVGKQLALQKFMKMVVGDWRGSKYAYVISSLKTSVYEISSCVDDCLACIDKLGRAAAECNNASPLFIEGKVAQLGQQNNYVCLESKQDSAEPSGTSEMDGKLVKQRTDAWHTIRNTAQVTGSTCHAAIGLDTLKKQQTHYKHVFDGDSPAEFSDDVKQRMKHGTDNEINAVATLVGKILPVFYPEVNFVEEGCYVLDNGNARLVVSPDGSCRSRQDDSLKDIVCGVEIKCPFPGKLFTTPVSYSMPFYYVIQVLCEMAALKVTKLLFVCYSPDSTTVFEAAFDEGIWKTVCDVVLELYGPNHKFPTKLHPSISKLRRAIREYPGTHVRFIAEISSLLAVPCTHVSTHTQGKCHYQHEGRDLPTKSMALQDVMNATCKGRNLMKTAYSLQRNKASEVLMFLMSDLDRMSKKESSHAIPIGYAFKGYSMKTDVMRQMVEDVLNECYRKGLYTPVVSFDGQWYNIAVRSKDRQPMTLLQLQKDVFAQAKKETKASILKVLFSLNCVTNTKTLSEIQSEVDIAVHVDEDGYYTAPIIVGSIADRKRPVTPSKHTVALLKSNDETTQSSSVNDSSVTLEQTAEDMVNNDHILHTLDADSIAKTDEQMLREVLEVNVYVNKQIQTKCDDSRTNARSIQCDISSEMADLFENDEGETTEQDVTEESVHMDVCDAPCSEQQSSVHKVFSLSEDDYQRLKDCLKDNPKSKVCETMRVETFKEYFADHKKLSSLLNKHDAKLCLKAMSMTLKKEGIHYALSWPKYSMIALLCQLASGMLQTSNNDARGKRKMSISTLKKLCRSIISKFSKDKLNVVFAEYQFPAEFKRWQLDSPFHGYSAIDGIEGNITWYAKPELSTERLCYQFYLLDCHHILTNARVKCCKTGIPESGLNRDAWVKVAKSSASNKSGLSLALVEDLVDRQSNAFAQQTFSKEVEKAMLVNDDTCEAEFCKLIREWYEAEDIPGLPVTERCQRRLAFREWLLKDVHFNQFPPPGLFIKGIPLVMYEGLMTNIDRRLQLFPFVKKGVYNVRALGSLEAENIFGEFQDLDPRGSGVIRPDDIPSAISTACELLYHRLNPDRGFYMHTSKAKVYPVHQLIQQSAALDGNLYINPVLVKTIIPRSHAFDMEQRGKRKSGGRKSGQISMPMMAARGVRPVREHHRLNESKILPHVRRGLNLSD